MSCCIVEDTYIWYSVWILEPIVDPAFFHFEWVQFSENLWVIPISTYNFSKLNLLLHNSTYYSWRKTWDLKLCWHFHQLSVWLLKRKHYMITISGYVVLKFLVLYTCARVSNYYKQTSLNIFYSRKVWDMIGTSALWIWFYTYYRKSLSDENTSWQIDMFWSVLR